MLSGENVFCFQPCFQPCLQLGFINKVFHLHLFVNIDRQK